MPSEHIEKNRRNFLWIGKTGWRSVGDSLKQALNFRHNPIESPVAEAKRYDAFISYSHAADGELAPQLQAGLQRLAKPWYRLRAMRVFRDETDLTATPQGWTDIQVALSDSRFFLLLASEGGANSKWVTREIDFWLGGGQVDKLLIVLTGGDIVWDHDANDFDWAMTTALPQSLSGQLDQEPFWIDLRWAQTEHDVSVRNPDFLTALAKLAAPVRGIDFNELISEDHRLHKRAMRLAKSAVVVLTMLAIGLGFTAWVAIRERDRAVAARLLAEAENLSIRSSEALTTHPERAALLAIEAYNRSTQAEIRSANVQQALRDALSRLHGRSLGVHDRQIKALAFTTDGDHLLTQSHHSVRAWNLEDPDDPRASRLLTPAPDPTVISNANKASMALSRQGRWLVTASAVDRKVRQWDLHSHEFESASLVIDDFESGEVIALNNDGDQTVFLYSGIRLSLRDLTLNNPSVLRLPEHDGPFAHADFSADGHWLISGDSSGKARIWDLSQNDPSTSPVELEIGDRVHSVAISPDSNWMAVGAGNGARIWDLPISDSSEVKNLVPDHVNDLAISSDSGLLAIATRGGAYRLERNSNSLSKLPNSDNGGDTFAVAIGPEGRQVAVGSRDGGVRLYPIDQQGNRSLLPLNGDILYFHEDSVMALSISENGRWLASGSADGMVRVWDLSASRALAISRLVRTLAQSPDGQRLVTMPRPGEPVRDPFVVILPMADTRPENETATLWDMQTEPPSVLAEIVMRRDPYFVEMTPDNRWLVAGSLNQPGSLWKLSPFGDVEHPISIQTATKAAFSSDSRWLVTTDNTEIRLWELSNPSASSRVFKVDGPHRVTGVAVSSEAHWVVTVTRAGLVRLWRLGKHNEGPIEMRVPTDGQAASFASFSPDEHWLAVGAGNRASLVDLTQRDPSGAIIPISGHSPTFSKDNRWLFTRHTNEIRIWDLEDPEVQNSVVRLNVRSDERISSTYVVIEDSYQWLVARTETLSKHHRIYRWPLNRAAILFAAQQAVGRNLRLEEWSQNFPRSEYRKTFDNLPLPPVD